MRTIAFFWLLFFCDLEFCQGQNDGRIVRSDTTRSTISDKARTYYNEGYERFEKGDFAKAIELYKLAVIEDPEFIDAYDNLGLAFRQLKLTDSAEYYYLISLRKMPDGYTANQNMAIVEELRNNFSKAMAYYRKLIALEPQNPEGYYGAARMCLLQENFDEALKHGQLAETYYKQAKSPYIADCYYLLCIIAYNKKDLVLARKYLDLCKKEGVSVDKDLQKALQ